MIPFQKKIMNTSSTTLAVLRIGLGLFSWIAPDQTIELFGMSNYPIPSTSGSLLMARFFAIRELVLGGAVLVAKHPEAKKLVLQMGLISDSADLIASCIGYQNGLSTNGFTLTGAAAVIGISLGAHGLSMLKN